MELELNGKTITIGILAFLVTALAGMGGSELLEEDQYKNAYVCNVNDNLGVFLGGISKTTSYTGYTHAEDRTDPVRCNIKDEDGNIIQKGKWVKLEDYAKEKGVDPLTFLISQEPEVIIVQDDEDPAVPVIADKSYIESSPSGDYCCNTNNQCFAKTGPCN